MNGKKDDRIQLRLPSEYKTILRIKALEQGYKGVSDYIICLLEREWEEEEKKGVQKCNTVNTLRQKMGL
jgi:hypothetical protein